MRIAGIIMLCAGVGIAGMGVLFKIMHWPLSRELVFFGGLTTLAGVVLAIVGVVIEHQKKQKRFEDED